MNAIPLEGLQWVEASAGTGKTFTITTLYLRLLTEASLTPREILVVTYTKAATAELRDRLRARVAAARDALVRDRVPADEELRRFVEESRAKGLAAQYGGQLQRALVCFDEAAIHTVHGFCQRVLEERAFESGVDFDRELVPDPGPLIDDGVRDFFASTLHDAPEALLSQLGHDRVSLESLSRLAGFLLSNPDARLQPERQRDSAIGSATGQWSQALEAMRAAWQEHGAAALSLLCEDEVLDGLNKGSYKPDRILGSWSVAIEDALRRGRPGSTLHGFDFFRNLCAGSMRMNRGLPEPAHPFFDACAAFAEADAAFAECLSDARVELELEFAERFVAGLERRKQEERAWTYDDLLTRLRDALRGAGGARLAGSLREAYAVALVDEFQDTDPVQWEIFERVWADPERPGRALFLIGDPKQAIYGFRGADVFAYLAARAQVSPGSEHTLLTNWRSTAGLIAGVNALFEAAANPFELEEIAYRPVEPSPKAPADSLGRAPLRFLFAAGPEVETNAKGKAKKPKVVTGVDVPLSVAADIARWLDAPPDGGDAVRPKQFAVLCRSNQQAREVQSALRQFAVPSVLQSDSSVFEGEEALWLERLLRALAEPRSGRRLRAALATPLLGVTAPELARLLEDEQAWDAWLLRTRRWASRWREDGLIQALRSVFADCEVVPRLVSVVGGERALTNLRHLQELLQAEAARGHHGPASLLRWFSQMIQDPAARAGLSEDTQLRLESDAEAVQLVTIHKSKGLEYDIVYCPYLWTSAALRGAERTRPRFHDPEADAALTLDLGSEQLDEHTRLSEREAMAEARRVLYVALTRARRHCSVLWGRFSGARLSALAGLLHSGDLGEMTDEAILEDLALLAARAPRAIGVEPLAGLDAPRYRGARPAADSLAARAFTRPLEIAWRSSSFSSLASAGERPAVGPGAEGRDYDAADAAPEAVAVDGARPADGEAEVSKVPLAEFPAGARPGTLLHEIFENAGFEALAGEQAGDEIERRLRHHGVDASWRPALSRALSEVVRTPIPDPAGGDAFALADLGASAQKAELEFALPVAAPGLRVSGLADTLAHSPNPLVRRYAAHSRTLRFAPLTGNLRGFIDLVFEHGGRYYLLDYKSNHLGEQRSDYTQLALEDAMVQHDYLLQYHLYWVALHRYLALRLRGFDYEQHMGGVVYLFLRGMQPGSVEGIFTDRPTHALTESLSGLLRGVAPGPSEGEA